LWFRDRRPPTLTSEQVRQIDRLTAERYDVPVEWLMEAAGWQVARLCRERAYVVCGKGNNGGDGLAAARHLHRWGRLAGVACVDRAALKGPASQEAAALEAGGVAIAPEPDLTGAACVVDALLGTGLSRAPEGAYADWIRAVNAGGFRVVAVDVPSGLEADSGKAHDPTVRASMTVTLGLPKPGLLKADGPAHAGEIWVADIGVPLSAYREAGIQMPRNLFEQGDAFRL
jgi:hydroxyethylthiazole kinase-like uncharacterized protein yjeF